MAEQIAVKNIELVNPYEDLKKHLMRKRKCPLSNTAIIAPVVMKSCNGIGSVMMSSAEVECKLGQGLFLPSFYRNGVKFLSSILQDQCKSTSEEQRLAVECFVKYLNTDEHVHCLQKMKDYSNVEKIEEPEIQAYLACHVFAPLVPGSEFVIDGKQFPVKMPRKCPMCDSKIKLDDTSFGSTSVWYGYTDILVGGSMKSTVKVTTEKYINHDASKHSEDSCGEPVYKKQRVDSTGSSVDNETDTDDSLYNSDTSEDCGPFSFVEENLSTLTQGKKQAVAQAMAQTIVNAFCEVKQTPLMLNSFIPSFLATEKTIRIILYSVGKDKLLISQELMLFDCETGEVNISTLLYVWLTLNFNVFQRSCDDDFPKCGFKNFVTEHLKWSVYCNDVTRPLETTTEDDWLLFEVSDQQLSDTEMASVFNGLDNLYSKLYQGC